MVRPDAEDASARGDQRGRRPARRSADGVLRRGLGGPGTTAVGPGQASSSALESVELSTSYSSEFEAVEHHGREGAAGAAMHHGLPVRKGVTSENPRSGSGPSVSARPEGEQPVEGARNPEDGQCRAWNARVIRIPPLMSLKGRRTPGGATRSLLDRGGRLGPNPERETKPVEAAGRSSDRSAGRTAESLEVVKTTRRLRRTDVAAMPDGALREASQP
jgi:hypothetical protein